MVGEYTLTTGYDLTASNISFVRNFMIGSDNENIPRGIAFNPDGTRMFIVGTGKDLINEVPLSIAFSLSTASVGTFRRNFALGGIFNPLDIGFNATGTRVYLTGSQDRVFQYDLASAFTTEGANTTNEGLVDVTSQQSTLVGAVFNTNGDRMYTVGTNPSRVHQFTLNSPRALTVTNLGPTVTSVTGVDGFYKLGDEVLITIHFTDDVTVTGTPALALNLISGGSATYTPGGGSGTPDLTFTYTVAIDGIADDLNYISPTSLTLPGGATIQSTADPAVAAILTLPALTSGNSLGGGSAIVIDTIAPRIDSATTSIDGARIILVADETLVTNSPAASEYTLAGTDAVVTDIAHNDTTLTLTVSPSILVTDTDIRLARPASDTITDQAGNQLMAADTLSVTNAIPPTPTVLSVSGEDGSYKVGAEVPITITFSEAVTVSGTPQLELFTATGGSTGVATYTAGSVSDVLTFTYIVVDTDETSDLAYTGTDALSGTIQNAAATIDADLTLPVVDSATSLSGTSAVVLDTTVPVFPGTATTIIAPLVRTIAIGSTTTTRGL